jgi:hypothetical protein
MTTTQISHYNSGYNRALVVLALGKPAKLINTSPFTVMFDWELGYNNAMRDAS